MPYQFGYNVDDGYGNKQDRQEKGLSCISCITILFKIQR